MSTKKKSTIKFASLLMVFVLSVAYFSLLAPTSAYFYKTETKDAEVQFALFEIGQSQKLFEENATVNFPAATKFWDMDERLFDDAAIIKNVTLTNNGETTARIFVHITPDETAETNGFKYMVTKLEGPVTPPAEAVAVGDEIEGIAEKKPVKEFIETTLGLTNDTLEQDANIKLNEYNTNKRNEYVTIAPGESAEVEIVLWAEYGNIENTLKDTSTISKIDYNCHIEIIASQDTDEANVEAAIAQQ